jgi:hypothetical protein
VVDAVESAEQLLSGLQGPDLRVAMHVLKERLFAPLLDSVLIQTPPTNQHRPLVVATIKLLQAAIESGSTTMPFEDLMWYLARAVDMVQLVGAICAEHSRSRGAGSVGEGGMLLLQQDDEECAALLRAAAYLIVCGAQWAKDFDFSLTLTGAGATFGDFSSVMATDDEEAGRRAERDRVVSDLSVRGLLTVLEQVNRQTAASLAQQQATGGASAPVLYLHDAELSSIVFRLLRQVATSHTAAFLSVSPEQANFLLQATQFCLDSPDPSVSRNAFAVMEAIAASASSSSPTGTAIGGALEPLLRSFLQSALAALLDGAGYEMATLQAIAYAVFSLMVALGGPAVCLATFGELLQTRYPQLCVENGGRAESGGPNAGVSGGSTGSRLMTQFRSALEHFQHVSAATASSAGGGPGSGTQRRSMRAFLVVIRALSTSIRGARVLS